MRPAGRGPLESLYFSYPRFSARRAPELDNPALRHRIAIAGAGPIGMTAALTLARYGIASVILERKDTFNDGSRAICIARPSMRIFERIGAVESFLGKALGWRSGRSYFGDIQIHRLEMPHPPGEKFLPMYNLQQQYIEQFLHDAAAANPLIDMRWQSEVTGIAQADGEARLAVASPQGDYELRADCILAADGARSAVRSLLGLRLKGENYEGKYVIADIRMDHDFPTERRAFFEPASNPGGTVLIHKQPGNIWRIDYQLRDGESETEAVKEASIRARTGAILAGIGHSGAWELEWWSIYTANTLCLDEYRHGRVFFIGDSAHIVPIFGVRGLNNGIADAHNIGWKLAYVLNGVASHGLLDSYTPERRGATLDVFANAGKSARFMTPPSRGWRLMRQAALSLAVKHPFAREFANPRQMQAYTYSESPLTSRGQTSGGLVPGALAPDVKLADGRHLLDLAGGGFALLLFRAAALSADDLGMIEACRRLDPDFTVLAVGAGSEAQALNDHDGAAADVYGCGPGAACLLRPDHHIAYRDNAPQPGAIEAALEKALGRDNPR